MQPRKMKFAFVQINMKQVWYKIEAEFQRGRDGAGPYSASSQKLFGDLCGFDMMRWTIILPENQK